jgi:AcrR family transcriptional regulator
MVAQQRGEETRARILDAALEAFARYGYDATGVAEICRRAGVTKGGFYYHFPSKQAVFLEMLEGWLAEIDQEIADVRLGAANVPDELLRLTTLVHRVFQEASGRLPIFLEFLTKASHSATVWQATVAPFRKYHDLFAAMMRQGVEQGSLQPVDPDLASNVLLAYAVGLLAIGLLDPTGADWGQVVRDGMGVLLRGLAQEGETK